jgi:uncharacterized flavoprotein (TIGR03862 family)
VAVAGGAKVTVYDGKASVGRKFLVAGRGGLNLTHAEAGERFVSRYSGGKDAGALWNSLLDDFNSEALRGWAKELGVETFVATSGRVYPKEMKAAPLLRRWVQRLRATGVEFAMGHRWTGLRAGVGWQVEFLVGGEEKVCEADAVVMALGGGTWPETGSDGGWVSVLEKMGIAVAPLVSSNCGWEVGWGGAVLAQAEGKPLKNITIRAGETVASGELMVTRYGLEGGAIYQLGPTLRGMKDPEIAIDFKPTHTVEQLVKKLGSCRENYLGEARTRWRLGEAAMAILENQNRASLVKSAEQLARVVKGCVVKLKGPRPLAEAISSAGGVNWSELDDSLMLKRCPGVFLAGEMIDWDAPTGGYLIQGCFATGTRAGEGAREFTHAKDAKGGRDV